MSELVDGLKLLLDQPVGEWHTYMAHKQVRAAISEIERLLHIEYGFLERGAEIERLTTENAALREWAEYLRLPLSQIHCDNCRTRSGPHAFDCPSRRVGALAP